MRPPRIELHIEELTLHGFASGDRHLIAEAVERELARLFAERGVPPSFSAELSLGRLDAGSFQVSPGAGAEAVGAQVARSLYGGFGR